MGNCKEKKNNEDNSYSIPKESKTLLDVKVYGF